MTGNWKDPNVPNYGWHCTDVYDSIEDGDDLFRVCEMCESKLIRYIHVMEHRGHPPLEVGCVCAGKMEGDMDAAVNREAAAQRRSRFHLLKNWKKTERGNWRLHVEHVRLVVYHKGDGWAVQVCGRNHYDAPLWFDGIYHDLKEAKRAAFDALTVARQRGMCEPPPQW